MLAVHERAHHTNRSWQWIAVHAARGKAVKPKVILKISIFRNKKPCYVFRLLDYKSSYVKVTDANITLPGTIPYPGFIQRIVIMFDERKSETRFLKSQRASGARFINKQTHDIQYITEKRTQNILLVK